MRVLVCVAVLAVGCGRLGFGSEEEDGAAPAAITARLITGAATADLEICGGASDYWIATAPVGAWELETLEGKLADAAVLHAGRATPAANECVVITGVPIGPEQIAIYAYAMSAARDAAAEATAVMQPTWTRERSSAGVTVWVHRPETVYREAAAAPLPVLVFLHGWGHASGVGHTRFSVDSMPRDSGFLELFGQDVPGANPPRVPALAGQPFLVLAPNCENGMRIGSAVPLDCWAWRSGAVIFDELLAYARAGFAIDERRIYVTGLSTGGEGTLRLASERANQIAAAVPIAASYTPDSWLAGELCAARGVPIWAFHSANDTASTTSRTQMAGVIDQLNACAPSPAEPAQFDVGDWWTGTDGHGGWLEAYGETHGKQHGAYTSIYAWLLAHAR